ncbi:MAG: hypothetical protein ACOYMP_02825 [Nodosilinea sp.]
MMRFSLDRAFVIAASLAVGVAIVVGFWAVGTPGRQRQIAADQQRWQDLTTIAGTLHQDYLADPDHYQLPKGLTAGANPTDPLTAQPYEYQRLSDRRYQLCANFDTDSRRYPLIRGAQGPAQERRDHPQGRYCLNFDVSRSPD